MPTVIDSFVLEIGLDPKKFTAEQRSMLDSLRKFQDEAVKRGKDIEESSRRSGNAIQGLQRNVLLLTAALFGASSIKDFVVNITSSDAALGRFSRNIGVSVPQIAAWQNAAKQFGGTAEGMASSFTNLSDAFAGWKIGIVSPLIADLRAISTAGGKVIDVNKGTVQALKDLADNLKAIHDRDPAQAGLLGRRLGIDPGLFDMLVRGSEVVEKTLKSVRDIGTATEKDTEHAAELAKEWAKAEQSVTNLGRRILNYVTPAVIQLLGNMRSAFDEWPRKYSESGGLLGMLGFGSAGSADGAIPLPRPRPSSAPEAGSLVKPGVSSAGASIGLLALAASLRSDIPGLNRITSMTDSHAGGKHAQGLALDFTIEDEKRSAEVAAMIRAKLASMGVGGFVKDEYKERSPGWTGPHIHVQFNSPADARRYSESVAGGGQGAGGGISNRRSEVNIGTIVVNTAATDAGGIAKDIKPAIERNSFAAQAEAGPE